MFRVFNSDLSPRPSESDGIKRDHADRLKTYFVDENLLAPLVAQARLHLIASPEMTSFVSHVRETVEIYVFLRNKAAYQQILTASHRSGLNFIANNPNATTEQIIAHMSSAAREFKIHEEDKIAIFRCIIERALQLHAPTPKPHVISPIAPTPPSVFE